MKIRDTDTAQRQSCDSTRRRLLFGAGALPIAAGAGLSLQSSKAKAAIKTTARIVIVGSGLGGLAAANRLARELDGARITIVDRKEIHNYQPGYTLVATGVWPVAKVSDRNADLPQPTASHASSTAPGSPLSTARKSTTTSRATRWLPPACGRWRK